MILGNREDTEGTAKTQEREEEGMGAKVPSMTCLDEGFGPRFGSEPSSQEGGEMALGASECEQPSARQKDGERDGRAVCGCGHSGRRARSRSPRRGRDGKEENDVEM